MKRTKVESSLERQFIIAMIASRRFLSLAPMSMEDVSLLEATYARHIAKWCLSYYRKYRKAPGKSIEAMFNTWVEKEHPSEQQEEAVSDFLESLSVEYDRAPKLNVPHLVDSLAGYLTDRRLTKLNDKLTSLGALGKREDAICEVQSFRAVPMGGKTGFAPLLSKKPWDRAFAQPNECLVPFPNDAGRFLNHAFVRDSLLSFQAPEKRGKTFWLMEIVFRALRNRKNVVMFQCGDLSEGQILKRLGARMARIPLQYSDCKKGVKYPFGMRLVPGAEGSPKTVKLKTRCEKFAKPLRKLDAIEGRRKLRKRYKVSGREFRISVHSNSSINVAGIQAILERWKFEEGWVPDVILIDYADILAAEPATAAKMEMRDQVNQTWMALRKLSQDWNACVVAPTQASAASYGASTQSMKHFSNDKRKFAHVTGTLGLNQTPEEKTKGVMRLNWIVLREGGYETNQTLYVAQCLPLGMALVLSAL